MITKDGKKVSPKQWAVDVMLSDLELCTDYYYERYPDEWRVMSQKEQDEVSKQIGNFHNRLLKIIKKARKLK